VEQQSGTTIKIEKKPWDSGRDDSDKEKLITIKGGLKNTREAVNLILDKIRRGRFTFSGVSLQEQNSYHNCVVQIYTAFLRSFSSCQKICFFHFREEDLALQTYGTLSQNCLTLDPQDQSLLRPKRTLPHPLPRHQNLVLCS
jgi:hypothetical protein